MNDVNTQFAANQSILGSLKSVFDKVVAAGSNQQGYNAQEMNTLNSSVIQNTGQQYANAKKSLAENQAAQGGGNSMLPSGVASQQAATLGSAAANQAQSGLTQNLQASYNQGYQNYNNALSGELSVAGQQNATGMANAATGMSNSANSEANAVQQANQEATNNIMGLATGAISGAAGVMCPVAGSLFLMSDGTEKPVETLIVGEQLMGLDGEPQTIEEIQSAAVPIVCVKTENGHTARNSVIHAFAVPVGGFVVAAKSLGKTILTAEGPSKVVSVSREPEQRAYNVVTDGSHTYRADGVWALGQSDGERQVAAATWQKINKKQAVEEGVYVR
jgi:hypothetical protein